MEPYGKGAMDVLVVGEAPGETEDQQGRPFIGKAGQHLRAALRGIGVSLDKDVLTTNALICRPPANRTPEDKEIDYCRPNLLNTIRKHEPRVIITLGKSALVSVLRPYWKSDIGALERWVGWQIPLEQHWVCPTYHPSYLLRMQNQLLERYFGEHLEAAFSIERDPKPLRDLESKVECLFDEDKICKAIQWFDEHEGWCALDYETNTLKPEIPKARIVSCALSNEERTVSFPFGGNKVIKCLSWFLTSIRTRKIASNLKFEDRWSRHHVIHGGKQGVSNWGWDTMLAAHCLDNRPGICSLKFQSLIHLGVPTYNEHIDLFLESYKGPYNRVEEISISDLLVYNGIDAYLELKLAMFQRRQMGYEG